MKLPRSIRLLYEPWEYDDKNRKRFGAWSQSYSGERYWSLDPRPEEIHTEDIVMGLANAARYRGQTRTFYSVLTHCILVSREVQRLAIERGWSIPAAREAAFEALLHDASEAYLGDVARPLKVSKAMKAFCEIEHLWDAAVHERYGIHSTNQSAALVKEVDKRIVLDEIYAVMCDPDMWRRSGRYLDLEPLYVEVPTWTREESIQKFYERYEEVV